MVYAVSTHNNLDSLWLKLSYSNALQTLLISISSSSSSSKFTKVANLLEILTWYCSLTSKSFSFFRLSLSPSNFYSSHLFTESLSNFHNHQIMVNITVISSKTSDINCIWMPPSICQDKINLCVFPSREVQVLLWMLWSGNIVLLTITFFDVAKFTTLTPLSLPISC